MNTILEQINSAGFVFVKFALPMLVQSAVLIVVLLLADLLLRKKVRAVFRYWLWMLVLLKLILPTTLSSPVSLGSWLGDKLATVKLSKMSTPAESVNLPQMIDTETVAVTGTPQADVRPTVTRSPVAASLLVSPAPLTWQGTVFLVWVAAVAAMGLLLLQRAIFVTGLVAQAQNPAQLMNDAFNFCCGQMGIKGKVGLKVSANAASPAVCGLFRPVILVPQNLAPTLGSSRLRPVLLHELAHIKRGDLWINLVQTILQIIYFYNPLLWLANSIIRRIREQAVDETVQVAMGANAHQYLQTLLDVAKLAFNRPALSLRLIGVVESKSQLKGRIKRMLNQPIPKTAKLGILGLIALLIFAAVLLPMAKAKEKPQTETSYSSVTVTEGVGFDDIFVGDANCTGQFIKSKLGEPDEEVKNEKDWWLDYGKMYGLDFWVNPKENVLIEIRLNKGFKGKLTSGISMSSTKQDVFAAYGQPIREEVAEDFNKRFDNQVLLFRKPFWLRKPRIAKIYYDEQGLLFWFDGDTLNQIVVYRPCGKIDVAVEDFNIRPYPAGGLYTVTVAIHNKGSQEAPPFRLNFYQGDPANNLNLHGKPLTGSHGAGPIKPGNVWNESSSPFAMKEGLNEIVVVLDTDQSIAESDETNNRASMRVVVKDGQLIEQSVSYPPQQEAESPKLKTDVQVNVEEPKQINSSPRQNKSASPDKPAGLQQLIDSARPGATITIPKGVYTEPIEITKSLTLKGQSRNDCIFEVTADKPAIFIDTKGTVIIEDLTIKWQLATSDKKIEYPFAVAVKDTEAEVKNCSFIPLGNFKRCPTAIQAVGFSQLSINTCRFQGYEYTICYGNGAQGTVSDSLIADSGHQGISLYEGATVHIERNVVTGSAYHAVRSTGGTLFMKDNLIINNANRGVYLGNKSAKGTISNNIITGNETAIGGFAQSKVNIENNLILDSGYAGIGMEKSCSLVIRDNIFVNNERGWIMFDRGGNGANTCYRNTFWKNKVDAENFEKTADSITAEPRFVDPDNGDFSLKADPALEYKQGLTNPQVFKALWKIWQNRTNKNEPFASAGQSNLPAGSELEKASQTYLPLQQHNPVVSVYPPSGSKMALISELQVVFDQPMMPEEFKIVDASLEEKFEDWSDVAVVRSYVVYNADKYQFSMPLILPCNWNGSIQLGGFKTAKGVEVEPIVLNYTTSRDKFSGDLLQRFEKAKQSRELRVLLENVKNARSKLKSLSETVYYTYDFGDDEKSNKAIFKMQGRNQFYVDMSEEFEMPWHIGSDGEKCWFYNEHKDTKKLVAIDCDKIAEKKISICDPFEIAEADIDTVIKQNNIEYLGTEMLDGRKCHIVRSWLVNIEHKAACSIITWWFDSETYMPAKVVSDSGRWRVSYRFVYDRVNEPINDSEFRPESVTKIEPQEPEPLDENYNTRYIRIIDGSSSGRMSINWGKYGPAGTSESGLN